MDKGNFVFSKASKQCYYLFTIYYRLDLFISNIFAYTYYFVPHTLENNGSNKGAPEVLMEETFLVSQRTI